MGSKIALALACAIATVGLWAWWDLTIDDAYITFRYSQHLAEGHGPVWNVGQDPVQGYTNLLWMLALTPASWLGWSLPVTAKILGIAALAGTLWQTYTAAVDWSGRRGAGIAAVAALLLMVPTYVHTVAGLETMLYAGLLLRFVWSVTTDRPPWERAVLAVVLGMVRPEGWAVAGAGMLYVTWRDRDLWPLLASGAGVAAVVGWQWLYYGSPVPNTFFVKVGQTGDRGSLLTVLFVVGLAALLWSMSDVGRDRPWVVAALLVAAGPYLMSDLMMDYAMRFAYHLAPLAVSMISAAIVTPNVRPSLVVALGVGLAVVSAATVPPTLALYGMTLERSHVALGRALQPMAGEDLTLAVGDAGALPYYSGWATLDTIGLNDEPLAHGAALSDRIDEVQPDVIVAYPGPASEGGATGGRGRSLGLDGAYERAGEVQFRGGYRLVVLVAETLPQHGHIVDAVRSVEGYSGPVTWGAWSRHLQARALFTDLS